MKKLEEYVRSIPDFPEKGIIFRDVTSVLQDADGLHLAIGTTEAMIKLIESLGGEVAGIVVLIELAGLKGRERLSGYRLESAICYEGK